MKYGAIKVSHAGYSFASKGEAALFNELHLMERGGLIQNLKCQDSVYLTDARILYKPDFVYVVTDTQEKEWAEFKGYETTDWRIKRRLWQWYGPGRLKIYKGSAKKITLDEEIIPKVSQ